jgi:hypothetical protein
LDCKILPEEEPGKELRGKIKSDIIRPEPMKNQTLTKKI